MGRPQSRRWLELLPTISRRASTLRDGRTKVRTYDDEKRLMDLLRLYDLTNFIIYHCIILH